MGHRELPIPDHFQPERVGELWKTPYQERALEAHHWRQQHSISPAVHDQKRICLFLVDVQNTFCLPGYELYVGGRSGQGAVDDNRRLCEFIYRNLASLSEICTTMDTHQAIQIFHNIFLVDSQGSHPEPYCLITAQDIEDKKWQFNSEVASGLGMNAEQGQAYLEHYVSRLKQDGKYDLTSWPYHAMLGGVGHALVPAVEEAMFFHSIVRFAQSDFQIKGNNPLTENYSALCPEVLEDGDGRSIAEPNTGLIQKLSTFDVVIIAGQAKSHCVRWTIENLQEEIQKTNGLSPQNVYLLEDCTSPVVVPGVIDYTDDANEAFQKFAAAGMQVIQSTMPMSEWPGLQ